MEKLIPQIKKDVNVEQEPKVTIEYNDYEYRWLTENGFSDWVKTQQGQNGKINANFRAREFLAKVEPSKIKRNTTRMYRVKELDFITNPNKPKRREFLKVIEDWYGKAADGSDVAPVRDHINGMYQEFRRNEKGEPEATGTIIYYIPFTKANVDEWVNQSYLNDRDTIQFWVDTKQGFRRKQVSYEDFVNLKWDELVAKIDAKPSESNAVVAQLMSVVEKQQAQIEQLLKKGK
jgi:hypothetical protein